MENIVAVISAGISCLAALVAVGSYSLQRRDSLESARPELVLAGWSRRPEGVGKAAHEVIAFKTIRNVGRGSALQVIVNSRHLLDNRVAASLSTINLPILPPNEPTEVNGDITLWWSNVPVDSNGHRTLIFTIDIICWDVRKMRHETTYNLFAVESVDRWTLGSSIAPGVSLGHRRTVTRAVWWLKLQQRLGRIAKPFRRKRPKSPG